MMQKAALPFWAGTPLPKRTAEQLKDQCNHYLHPERAFKPKRENERAELTGVAAALALESHATAVPLVRETAPVDKFLERIRESGSEYPEGRSEGSSESRARAKGSGSSRRQLWGTAQSQQESAARVARGSVGQSELSEMMRLRKELAQSTPQIERAELRQEAARALAALDRDIETRKSSASMHVGPAGEVRETAATGPTARDGTERGGPEVAASARQVAEVRAGVPTESASRTEDHTEVPLPAPPDTRAVAPTAATAAPLAPPSVATPGKRLLKVVRRPSQAHSASRMMPPEVHRP